MSVSLMDVQTEGRIWLTVHPFPIISTVANDQPPLCANRWTKTCDLERKIRTSLYLRGISPNRQMLPKGLTMTSTTARWRQSHQHKQQKNIWLSTKVLSLQSVLERLSWNTIKLTIHTTCNCKHSCNAVTNKIILQSYLYHCEFNLLLQSNFPI